MRRLAAVLFITLLVTSCATPPTTPAPPAARAELAPTGKLRAGINFQNALLTGKGPFGEPSLSKDLFSVALELSI